MSVGFGFSVGDFIQALELVGTVIDALRESGGAGPEFRELVQELYILESALLRVKRIELDDNQRSDAVALWQAASQCQRTIDDFWKSIQKYQPYLQAEGSGSKVKDSWMKIRWAVCKKDDVASFKASLRGHISSIDILIATIQMGNTSVQGRKQDQYHKTLAGMVQESSFQYMRKVASLASLVTNGVQQGKKLLETTAHIMRTNIQIFQMVYSIQAIVTQIPDQINRQQPVYLIDALGKAMPFHLEFVQSADALVAVLKSNMRKTRIGPEKIDRGEFVLQEACTKQDIDLEKHWDSCFLPGQRVEMSMIFQLPDHPSSTCPSCRTICSGSGGEDIECRACGVTYRRVIEIDPGYNTPTFKKEDERQVIPAPHCAAYTSEGFTIRKRKRLEFNEESRWFRRVRISHMSLTPSFLFEKKCDGSGSLKKSTTHGFFTLRIEKGKLYMVYISIRPDDGIIHHELIRIENRWQYETCLAGASIYWTDLSGRDYHALFFNEEACLRIWQRISDELRNLEKGEIEGGYVTKECLEVDRRIEDDQNALDASSREKPELEAFLETYYSKREERAQQSRISYGSASWLPSDGQG